MPLTGLLLMSNSKCSSFYHFNDLSFSCYRTFSYNECHVTEFWPINRAHSSWPYDNTTTTTTVLRPFVQDYPVPEKTLTHPPSWSSSNLYQLLPSSTIHSILLVQITCLAIFLHNLFPCPLWSTSWSGALHLIFHTFLHPVSVFFSQHMPMPSQPVLL